jgi:hypothetical protein
VPAGCVKKEPGKRRENIAEGWNGKHEETFE